MFSYDFIAGISCYYFGCLIPDKNISFRIKDRDQDIGIIDYASTECIQLFLSGDIDADGNGPRNSAIIDLPGIPENKPDFTLACPDFCLKVLKIIPRCKDPGNFLCNCIAIFLFRIETFPDSGIPITSSLGYPVIISAARFHVTTLPPFSSTAMITRALFRIPASMHEGFPDPFSDIIVHPTCLL